MLMITMSVREMLTKPRKQTLSVQAPQQPRNPTTVMTTPQPISVTGTRSITNIGAVGLSLSSTPISSDSWNMWIHNPTPTNAHPANCTFTTVTLLVSKGMHMLTNIIISLIRQLGSNKRKIQIKYKIQNKQTTIKYRACKHTDETQ